MNALNRLRKTVKIYFRGVANFVGLPKDLTTERTEITEKNLCILCDLRGEGFF